MSSLLLFRWRAQSAMLVQASESWRASEESPMISILSWRSEKLLSLKANPKSASDDDEALREKSESITVLRSNRSEFKSLIICINASVLAIKPASMKKKKKKKRRGRERLKP